jgi:hypothetical protein
MRFRSPVACLFYAEHVLTLLPTRIMKFYLFRLLRFDSTNCIRFYVFYQYLINETFTYANKSEGSVAFKSATPYTVLLILLRVQLPNDHVNKRNFSN